MPYNCCVFGCNATTKCRNTLFHAIPTDPKRMKLWVNTIRSGKKPSVHAKVCEKHFLPDDYRWNAIGDRRFLKQNAVPSQNLPKRKHDKERSDTALRREARYINKFNTDYHTSVPDVGCEVVVEFKDKRTEDVSNPTNINSPDAEINMCQSTTQTIVTLKGNQLKSFTFCNDNQIQYYTGLSSSQFQTIHSIVTLHEDLKPSVCNISTEDQLFLTMYKLRHCLHYTFIANEFGVSRQAVRDIFLFWIRLLYQKLKCIDFWQLNKVRNGQYTAIIDCSEIPLERSSDPEHQQITFSHYKNTNTLKFLIAVSESGMVTFCSEAFGGSISDQEITKRCGFLDNVSEGDNILADKGFDIGGLLAEKKAALNIPPFRKGGKMPEKDVFLTRAIANRRILVERVIGLAKTYDIMVQKIPLKMLPIMSEIIYISVMLCNFRGALV